jgi:hypothetical protein
MVSAIAGIKIPDSKMARDLTQLIRDTEPVSQAGVLSLLPWRVSHRSPW